jgi:hypothetical protein
MISKRKDNEKMTEKYKLREKLKRLTCLLGAFAIIIASLAFSPVTAQAASYTGMKLPSDKVLASYVKKYVVEENRFYSMNIEALKALPVKEKAKVVATMCNCCRGTFSSSKKKTNKYINKLGRAFGNTQTYSYLSAYEAPSFFYMLSKNLNIRDYEYIDEQIGGLIVDYIMRYEEEGDVDINDFALDKYDQVLDIIKIIDGKIESGAGCCKLLTKANRYDFVKDNYERHNVSVYLVTKPGTVKYKSVDDESGKKKTFKKKYISLEAAIDKEALEGSFTDKQIKNMITVDAANEELAELIHKKLLNGDEFALNIRAPKKEAKVILKDIDKLICKRSGGYTFLRDLSNTITDTCVYVNIKKDYANVYKKSGEFFTQLEARYKAKAADRLAGGEYSWLSNEFENVDDSKLSYIANTPFADLSDAGKLYVIMFSGIFDWHYGWLIDGRLQKEDGEIFYSWGVNTYEEALQNLQTGYVSRISSVIARYEMLVFRMLGFECYYSHNALINHAWTVARVTNNVGKEMWVPFDYGIGPCEDIDVSQEVREQYLATEEMRYSLYLYFYGIEEAPKYKNFTLEDFFE